MTDEQFNNPPTQDSSGQPSEPAAPASEAANNAQSGTPTTPTIPTPPPDDLPEDERYEERLERLGGVPAPVITPEEFARLQRAGQVHIDARGRVQTARRSDAEAGVSLRKRRAWYAG